MFFFGVLWYFFSCSYMDKYDTIEKILEVENSEAFIRRLNDPVLLTVNEVNNTYTKAQASQILKKFFKTYPISEYKIEAKGNSEDNTYYNILYISGTKNFKMYLLFKNENGRSTIREVKISKL